MGDEKYHDDYTYGEKYHDYHLVVFGPNPEVECSEPYPVEHGIGYRCQYKQFDNNSNSSK